jgi:fructosamine-3-kinase
VIPPGVREVTPAWLTGLLRDAGALDAGEVAAVEPEPIGTFSTEIWRLRLAYDREAADAPSTLVVKRPSGDRELRSGETWQNEIRLYREVAAALPVRTPRLWYGGVDGARGSALLLLEDVADLRSFSFLAQNVEHSRRALADLARMHARFRVRAESLDWVADLADEKLRTSCARGYDESWARRRGLFRELGGESFVEIGDALAGRVAESLEPLGECATLLHGDAHGENLPLAGAEGTEPEVVFLDWPGPRRGHPSFDVGAFLAMTLTEEDRRRAERELVALHAERFGAAGGSDLDDPWLGYRRGVLARAASIVEIGPTFPENPLGRSALRMVVGRIAAAAVDLEVGELIR